ncbi:MAG: hypothetical protein BM557_06285 [Flavobacterium sp. MedPE-SWcel]|uniref:hypothetical protein n=1 Tax=uncultured Flavobacterium sp. TaxID=165435 RepID=UPI0009240A20|nr:hypothetical protein [uncultured Flavobacterium sp.]OIQ19309.1 MAG: hypothetical protein BM557_06285 [Flavobacterium sp. MedPE-SWcel]
MTNTTQNTATSTNTENEKRPNWRLVQEKAYFKTARKGQSTKATKTIELAVGWKKTSEKGINYISWSDSVIPVLPDVDGRIVTRAFEITYDN